MGGLVPGETFDCDEGVLSFPAAHSCGTKPGLCEERPWQLSLAPATISLSTNTSLLKRLCQCPVQEPLPYKMMPRSGFWR